MELSPYIELALYDRVQDIVCRAVAVRILGKTIHWVDVYGVTHKVSWDPDHDAVFFTLPPSGEDEHPGPLS